MRYINLDMCCAAVLFIRFKVIMGNVRKESFKIEDASF